jgi:hypothetical protein
LSEPDKLDFVKAPRLRGACFAVRLGLDRPW